jgi:hypothetical protein
MSSTQSVTDTIFRPVNLRARTEHYATVERNSPEVRPYGLRYENGCRFLAVQVWEWDGNQYDLRIYLTRESPDGKCEARVLRSRYYAVSIARLMQLLVQAGFCDVGRRDNVLFQPVFWGRRVDAPQG